MVITTVKSLAALALLFMAFTAAPASADDFNVVAFFAGGCSGQMRHPGAMVISNCSSTCYTLDYPADYIDITRHNGNAKASCDLYADPNCGAKVGSAGISKGDFGCTNTKPFLSAQCSYKC